MNNESQDFSINTFDGDNSFYDPSTDVITMGEGGVDDAEDAEVIWHEYGHAIQDDVVPGFGESEQAGAIGEGFGDYWAVQQSIPVSKGYDIPCVMDWDATSYTDGPKHCLRRTDTGKTTDDIDGEVHDDGEIWSNALWDIQKALGRTKANKVILQGTFFYAPDTSFADAARVTVQSARLLYGKAPPTKVTTAFKARKILSLRHNSSSCAHDYCGRMSWSTADIPDLTGRRALVTGATSGLGYETALELLKHGAEVIIAARNPEKSAKAAVSLATASDRPAPAVLDLDLSDLSSVAKAADSAHTSRSTCWSTTRA